MATKADAFVFVILLSVSSALTLQLQDGSVQEMQMSTKNDVLASARQFAADPTAAQLQKLLAPDGQAGDRFGISVSISGNGTIAAIGANTDDALGTNTGYAYIFSTTTGEMLHKLVPGDRVQGDTFGNAVSISGDGATVAIGAQLDDDKDGNSGAVYVFSAITGQQLHKLVPTGGASADRFGNSVSMSRDGTKVAIGSPQDDAKGSDSGSAYIFSVSTGEQLHKLMPDDGADNDRFGNAVSMSSDGTIVAIGVEFDDENANNSGSVYIFSTVTGQQLHKLAPADGAQGDMFGNSVSISGNGAVVAIGAYQADDKGQNSGSVYVFSATTGQQLQKLSPADGDAGDLFGVSVSISGDGAMVAVGAWTDDAKGSNSGSTYIFSATTGLQLYKLVPGDGSAEDRFGLSVSISEDGATVAIGAHEDDDKGADSGSSYIYSLLTGSPTMAPTQAPQTTAPTGDGGSAMDDPHVTTLAGDRFAIGNPSVYTLLRLPKDEQQQALLEIRANVSEEPRAPCKLYIKWIELTGAWMGGNLAQVFPLARDKPGSNTAGHITERPFSLVVHMGDTHMHRSWSSLAKDWSALSPQVGVRATEQQELRGMTEGQVFEFMVGSAAHLKVQQASHQALNFKFSNIGGVGVAEVGGLLGTDKHAADVEKPTGSCLAARPQKWKNRDSAESSTLEASW